MRLKRESRYQICSYFKSFEIEMFLKIKSVNMDLSFYMTLLPLEINYYFIGATIPRGQFFPLRTYNFLSEARIKYSIFDYVITLG